MCAILYTLLVHLILCNKQDDRSGYYWICIHCLMIFGFKPKPDIRFRSSDIHFINIVIVYTYIRYNMCADTHCIIYILCSHYLSQNKWICIKNTNEVDKGIQYTYTVHLYTLLKVSYIYFYTYLYTIFICLQVYFKNCKYKSIHIYNYRKDYGICENSQ